MGAFDDLIPEGGGKLNPESYSKAKGQLRAMDLLDKQLSDVERQYNESLKGGWDEKGLAVIGEYLPSPRNKKFNAAAGAMLPLIRQALSTSAKDGDSDRELAVWENLLPNSSSYDAENEQRIKQLRRLIDTTRQRVRQDLGIKEPAAPKSQNLPGGWKIKRVR